MLILMDQHKKKSSNVKDNFDFDSKKGRHYMSTKDCRSKMAPRIAGETFNTFVTIGFQVRTKKEKILPAATPDMAVAITGVYI